MLKVHKHTFNPFQENTYIIEDETKECIIIDPGCSSDKERNQLTQTIRAHGLKPVKLLNTHCHIDHFPGNKFVCDTYNLLPEFHETELQVMYAALDYQSYFGFNCEASPEPKNFLKEGDEVKFGKTVLKVLFVPGHSPGHLAFYYNPQPPEGGFKDKQSNEDSGSAVNTPFRGQGGIIFSGDVLFQGSVGRFDIPGADGQVLFKSLTEVMMKLPDDVKVYSGHGPETFIGIERRNNPFLQSGASVFN